MKRRLVKHSVKRRFLLVSLLPLLGCAASGFNASDHIPETFPKPKYWFGQRVRLEWVCDDHLDSLCGQTKWVEGIIVGMWFDSPELLLWCGWAYAFRPIASHDGHFVEKAYIVGENELVDHINQK